MLKAFYNLNPIFEKKIIVLIFVYIIVSPGAKERNVQITGPEGEKVE